MIEYLKVTVRTSARMTESHDIQFAAAYFQRDVASIGVRSATYHNDATHTFPLEQSVDIAPACTLPSGAGYSTVITLAWSSYSSLDSSSPPTTVTISYVSEPTGAGGAAPFKLVRIRCSGSATPDSLVTVARNLTASPYAACSGGVTVCTDSTGAVPTAISMTLTSRDLENNDGSTYQATLWGERRQT